MNNPSYDNAGGTDDRTAIITVTKTFGIKRLEMCRGV
jgi:hypothetical protein